jgi:uncharacterized repeat protein (TIGR03803 family)
MKKLLLAVLIGAVDFAAALCGSAAQAANMKVLYAFCPRGFPCSSDGASPLASLFDLHDVLYGTTLYGGQFGEDGGEGTVFSLDPNTGAEQVLSQFAGEDGTSPDGAFPESALIELNGKLYGTTEAGGRYNQQYGGYGTVFSINPDNHAERMVWSFGGYGDDGIEPLAGLVALNGILYGTTSGGGEFGSGTVFSFDPRSGAEAVTYSFCSQQNCADGAAPGAGLITVNGKLYGTTVSGGQYNQQYGNNGVVFSFDPKTGAERVLWSFSGGIDGGNPKAGLISVKGRLYGTTYSGGQYDYGTIFVVDPIIEAEKALWSFGDYGSSTDGEGPVAGLMEVGGSLYGTTKYGGANGQGSVFAFRLNSGSESVLYSFCSRQNCTDGVNPQAGLIPLHGMLYGTTVGGGKYGFGTAFELAP